MKKNSILPAEVNNKEIETDNNDVDLSQFAPTIEGQDNLPTKSSSFIKKFGLGLVLIFLLIIGAVSIYSWNLYQKISIPHQNSNTNSEPTPTPDPNIPVSFLLMGYGGGGHQGGKLTDTIMLVYIQPKLNKIDLISVPRDLWVSFPVNGTTESYWKINAAYALGSDDKNYPNKLPEYSGTGGGGELAKFAIQKVTGIKPDHYAVLDFYSFQKAIDILGGVEVNVEKSFDDYKYPIEGEEDNTCEKSAEEIASLTATMSGQLLEDQFPCRYEHLHFDKGLNIMDGSTALKYVRSRHSATDGGDFNRAARQRQLILGVKEKVLSVGFLPKAIPFLNSLTDDFHTDMDLNTMSKYISKIDDWNKYTIKMTALTTDNVLSLGVSQNGQSILKPKAGIDDWISVQSWLQTQLSNTEEATNSADVTSSN